MTRRTASRAKVPRCESENRVQPVVVSSSTGERVEGRVFESPAATKRTARDRETGRKSRSGPLATANGYRPADGWGVVSQAWRPGKTGTHKTKKPRWIRAGPVQSDAGVKMQNDDTTILSFGERADAGDGLDVGGVVK